METAENARVVAVEGIDVELKLIANACMMLQLNLHSRYTDKYLPKVQVAGYS